MSYLGKFSDEITTMLINLSENYLEEKNQFNKLNQKVSFLIAECFQNVVRYGVYDDSEIQTVADFKEFFQIKVLENSVSISSSNLVENDSVKSLEEKINLVNSLSEEELKQLHRSVLENGKLSTKGGASLGLIDMVKKSGHPLKNLVTRFDDEYSQIYIGVEISKSKDIKNIDISILDIEKEYKTLVDRNILLLFKGDFSKGTVSDLVDMLNSNFTENNKLSSNNTKNLITIIEIIQNVSKHGKSINGFNEGIITLSNTNNKFQVECANYISTEKYSEFKSFMDEINSLSLDEINLRYKMSLSNPIISEKGNCGLGIMEIARNSQKGYNYSFVETSEKEIFYSIKVNLI